MANKKKAKPASSSKGEIRRRNFYSFFSIYDYLFFLDDEIFLVVFAAGE